MSKISVLVWIVLAPTLMGIFVLVVILVPSLGQDEMKWIPYASIAGAVVAIPISYFIARAINKIGKI